MRLLHRTTRSVALTEAGELLRTKVTPATAGFDVALQQTRCFSDVPSGRLRINAPSPGRRPCFGCGNDAVPVALSDHHIEIIAETSLVDLVAEGFDPCVRYCKHLAQDMIAVSLGPPELHAVAVSPHYVARHGCSIVPQHLLQNCCIRTRFASGALLDWEFGKDGYEVRVAPKVGAGRQYSRLSMEAAEIGLGFFATFEGFAREAAPPAD